MWIANTIAQARQHRGRMTGLVALVPTMGALHKGHLWLIESARQLAAGVVVSIFVNPIQFGPEDDFDRYPRCLDQDLAACERSGVVGVFCPPVAEMYPPGRAASQLIVPELADPLEGEQRPGHFAGVCRVVAKLLNIVQPEVACFGQKDYQQLRVIEAMVQDLAMPVRVVGVPTVREEDGLAASSRNAYLTCPQRRQALGLYKALVEAKTLVETGGESDPAAVEAAMDRVLRAYRIDVDYAVVRHPRTLASLQSLEPDRTDGVVTLVAGRVGGVRLIDNMVLAQPSPDWARQC